MRLWSFTGAMMRVIEMLKKLREKWKNREGRKNITKRVFWGVIAGMIASLIVIFLMR